MKVGFYSPYIPDSSIGGGEKHLLDMAMVIAKEHDVSILLDAKSQTSPKIAKRKYEKFFDIDLSKITFVCSPLGGSSFLKKLVYTKNFDYLFYWTDGSLFFSLAGQNNLHLQIPFGRNKTGFIDRIKLGNWRVKNANSEFTRRIIEKNWHTDVEYVVNPMVDINSFDSSHQKQNIILNVGRFFRQQHTKRQDVLVDAFKNMVESHKNRMKGWQLVLIGTNEDQGYLDEVKAAADGFDIKILNNVSRSDLIDWYNRASIYWHATGYGVNQVQQPEKVEHFGITTVEAMAAGVVPVVINKGGQPEILGNSLSELLWNDLGELQEKTIRLITKSEPLANYQKKAVEQAKKFSKDEFSQRVKEMIAKTSVK